MVESPVDPPWVRTMANTPMFVGLVANDWNKLEFIMAFVAAPLMGVSIPIARVTLYAMNPPARRDYLSAVLAIGPWPDSVKARVESYIKEFERLRRRRNDVVHGRWDFTPAEGDDLKPVLRVMSGRSDPKDVATEQEIKDIIKTVNEIQHLQTETISLGQHLQSLIPTNMRR